MVNPGDFIKLAERTGLITPLTYRVLEAALRQSYAWHEQGLNQPLSVNLSARDLRETARAQPAAQRASDRLRVGRVIEHFHMANQSDSSIGRAAA